MKKKKNLPRWTLPVGLVAGLILLALVGYLALISPQKKKAASIQEEVDQTLVAIAQAREAARPTSSQQKIRVADLFRLTKAMPDDLDMPGILLQLNRVATDTGVTFKSITPHAAVTLSGYQIAPIDLVFDGNYYDLSDFLYRLRNLVDVRHGELDSRGRLFTVDSLAYIEGEKHFPDIQASLTIDAFVYGGVPAPTDGSAPAPSSTGATTTPATTGTTPATTSPAPAGATVAAGVSP